MDGLGRATNHPTGTTGTETETEPTETKMTQNATQDPAPRHQISSLGLNPFKKSKNKCLKQ